MNSILDNLLKTAEQAQDNPFVLYAIGIEYKNRQEYQSALAWFEKVLSNFPDYVPCFYHMAETLCSLGRDAEAKSIYERGIEAARKASDMHALSELEAGLAALLDE